LYLAYSLLWVRAYANCAAKRQCLSQYHVIFNSLPSSVQFNLWKPSQVRLICDHLLLSQVRLICDELLLSQVRLVGRCGVVRSTLTSGSICHGFESEHCLFSHYRASAFSKLRSLTLCSLDDSVSCLLYSSMG